MSRNVLLLSVETLKERTAVHSNIDEKLLYPEIKAAQDMYIHPLLGTTLYDKILDDINASGTTTGAYKTLLDNYIVDCLLNYVLASLPVSLPYQFWNKGVLRKQGENTELPSIQELLELSEFYKNRAEWYGQRMVKYLEETADETTLTEYIQQADGIDKITPAKSAFTMPIYLGESGRSWSLDKYNCNDCG